MAKEKKKFTAGEGKGLIQAKGDSSSYLGHFRSADVMKKGHNQGFPGMPGPPGMPNPLGGGGGGGVDVTHPALNPLSNPEGFRQHMQRTAQYDPSLNPVRAQRQAGRAALALTPAGGGARRAQRAENRAAMTTARQEASAIPRSQRRATAQAAVKQESDQTKAAQQARSQTMRQNVQTARQGLQSATAGVREARRGVRQAVRGGDVAGAGKAAEQLTEARGARKAARKQYRAEKPKPKPKPSGGGNGGPSAVDIFSGGLF